MRLVLLLPPGVPFGRQQYYALMTENGVLDMDDQTKSAAGQYVAARRSGHGMTAGCLWAGETRTVRFRLPGSLAVSDLSGCLR